MSAATVECEVVPSVCRRIAALVAVLCLGISVPVTTALAQGAGDQQYQDPFGDSGSSGSGSSGSSGTKTTPSTSPEPLTPSPQTSGTGSTTAGTGAAAPTPSSAPAATGSLPNTGLDARVLLLGGAVLLLCGLGLRLRWAPERF